MEVKFAERSDCSFAVIGVNRVWKLIESCSAACQRAYGSSSLDLKSTYFGDLRRISITKLISELGFLFGNDFRYYWPKPFARNDDRNSIQARKSEKDEENHFAGKYFAFERFLLFVVARDWVFSPLSCDYEVKRGVASFEHTLSSLMLPLSRRSPVLRLLWPVKTGKSQNRTVYVGNLLRCSQQIQRILIIDGRAVNCLLIISLLFAADVHCCRPSFPKNCFSRLPLNILRLFLFLARKQSEIFEIVHRNLLREEPSVKITKLVLNFLRDFLFLTLIVNRCHENLLFQALFDSKSSKVIQFDLSLVRWPQSRTLNHFLSRNPTSACSRRPNPSIDCDENSYRCEVFSCVLFPPEAKANRGFWVKDGLIVNWHRLAKKQYKSTAQKCNFVWGLDFNGFRHWLAPFFEARNQNSKPRIRFSRSVRVLPLVTCFSSTSVSWIFDEISFSARTQTKLQFLYQFRGLSYRTARNESSRKWRRSIRYSPLSETAFPSPSSRPRFPLGSRRRSHDPQNNCCL